MLYTPNSTLRTIAVPIPVTAADLALYGRGCWLMGYDLAETTGAANASVVLVSGPPGGGVALVPVNLGAGANEGGSFGTPGIPFDGGVSLHVAAGSVSGCVWVAEVV